VTALGIPNLKVTFATFMHRIGRTGVAPTSWKDLFFPDIHDWPGG